MGNYFYSGAVDRSGNIFVLDTRDQTAKRQTVRLLKCDDQGSLIWTVKLYGRGGTTTISSVRGIDVDNAGNVYVLVTGLGLTTNATEDTARVMKYDDQGSCIWDVDIDWGDADVTGLRVDDKGKIYVFGGGTTSNHRFVKVLDDQGSSIWTGATTLY